MRGGRRPLAAAPGANREGADALTGRRVAWFSRQPKTQATVGHATHPPADAGFLRLCFLERKQNLYTSRTDSLPVLSTPRVTSNNLSQDGSQYGSRAKPWRKHSTNGAVGQQNAQTVS
jgi:hypothetical protein